MKTSVALTLACVASASAFAPQQAPVRQTTELNALFNKIFDMDLFAPKKDQNDYGARNKKTLVTGKITANSYVPNGLTADQYNALRAQEAAKKAANYQRNVAKAGKFLGYDEFYLKRGTDLSGNWKKDVNLGHRMAKTKYDWSGAKSTEAKGWFSGPQAPKQAAKQAPKKK